MRAGGRIGRYQLLGLLAKGGMAQVFLALSGELSGFRTLVVVKRVLPHLASNAQFIRMFFDEARIAALLDHPNIVRIIEVGQDDDEFFLAMEVVQGRSLSSVLRRSIKCGQPFTAAQSAFVVAQAANGLGHAHNLADTDGRLLNIVHRDVSPQNILVSFEGAVKVIDFGVARALGRVTETCPGGLKGKIQYMAPEQAAAGEVDRRSDVFALGVVLWEALCGRRLFRRESELESLRAIINEPIPPPSKIVRISPRLERIVMRSLEKDPARRFQTAQEMALELERHAFASEGFSPLQIADAMKGLFSSDHLRWKRTVAAASRLEGAADEWSNTTGTFLRPQSVDLHTRGQTVALHPAGALSRRSLSGYEHPTGSRTGTSSETSLSRGQAAKDGMWIFIVGALLALLLPLGVTARLPPLNITAVRPASGETTMAPVGAIAAQPGAQAVVPSVPPDAPSPAALTTTVPTNPVPTPVPAPTPAPFVFPGARQGPDEEAQRLTKKSRAAKRAPARRSGARPVAARQDGNARQDGSAKEDASATCSLTVGTRPWAEVWLDGRNTGAHTPFTREISCGTHVLSLKRPDLHLSKTLPITLRPGEPFKQSLSLHDR